MAFDDKKSFSSVVRIRGHTLLCFQGFRGLGYSEAFVANMNEIFAQLQKNPRTLIEPLAGPDQICSSCPNLKEGGCQLHGPGTETHMISQDFDVLKRLGLKPNQRVSWKVVLERIAQNLQGKDLPAICGNCPWLHLGYCAQGIDQLKQV